MMCSSFGNVSGESESQAASRTRLAGCQPPESVKFATTNPSCGGLTDIRSDNASRGEDPISLFQTWFQEAVDSAIEEPSAMTVATVDPDGSPDARMILLKGVDERGFVFYTNLGSAKALALMHDPRVALCFYWGEIGKQVRVRGLTNPVSDEEADAYFATRARLSQISAWASKQSQPMRGYFELESEVAKSALRFGLGKIPRPPFWSGFRVVPERIEFWLRKPFRRHQRILYEQSSNGWQNTGSIRNENDHSANH